MGDNHSPMRTAFVAIGALWLLGFALLWTRLPATLIVHFDIAGQPDAEMSRLGYAAFASLVLAGEGAVLALTLPTNRGVRIAAILLFALQAGTFLLMALYNVNRSSAALAAVTYAAVASAVLVVGLVILGSVASRHRSSQLGADVIAIERHQSRRRFYLNAPFLIVPLVVVLFVPALVAKVVAALAGLVGLWALALLARGFTYRFSRQGVDVLGFAGHVFHVPASDIERFEIASVDALRDYGGWGIRGSRQHRGYILDGAKGVRIITKEGDLFLAHDDPSRLSEHLRQLMVARA